MDVFGQSGFVGNMDNRILAEDNVKTAQIKRQRAGRHLLEVTNGRDVVLWQVTQT